jgi:hypothetical protein
VYRFVNSRNEEWMVEEWYDLDWYDLDWYLHHHLLHNGYRFFCDRGCGGSILFGLQWRSRYCYYYYDLVWYLHHIVTVVGVIVFFHVLVILFCGNISGGELW